jgi:6-pyruvoyltetrahydropterin/6-carboxytetrahydropterin synthase
MPYELTVRDHFSAAHNLRAYRGKCEHLHGHNWNVDLLLEGADLDEEGMLMDFAEVKQVLAGVLDRFDHQYLNEVPPFDRLNPSCENLARVIAEEVAARLPAGVRLAALTAWESERCSVTYRPPAPVKGP